MFATSRPIHGSGSRFEAGGTREVAVVLPDDDARKRLNQLPRMNSLLVRMLGTDLTTVRIDLHLQPAETETSAPRGVR